MAGYQDNIRSLHDELERIEPRVNIREFIKAGNLTEDVVSAVPTSPKDLDRAAASITA